MTDQYKEFVTKFDREHPNLTLPSSQHPLSRTWVLWTHSPDSVCKDWTLDGYKKHCEIKTVEEFWYVFNGLRSLTHGDLWFLMQAGVPPRWEEEINRQGGTFNFRITPEDIDNRWLTLAIHLVTDNICQDPQMAKYICGISVSPKQSGLTLAIWVSDSSKVDCKQFPSNIEGIVFDLSIFKTHRERMLGDKDKKDRGTSRGRGRGTFNNRSSGRDESSGRPRSLGRPR